MHTVQVIIAVCMELAVPYSSLLSALGIVSSKLPHGKIKHCTLSSNRLMGLEQMYRVQALYSCRHAEVLCPSDCCV